MLRRRLTIRFALQISFAGILLIVLAVLILDWMFKELNYIDMKRNFSPYGISKLIDEAEIDEHGKIINSELLKLLKEDGGWLQSLDEQGNVLQSFYTPDDIPQHYNPGQLIDFWEGTKPFPYMIGLWIHIKGDRQFIILYGKSAEHPLSLRPYIEASTINNGTIHLSDSAEAELEEMQGWIQIIDSTGSEIAAWNKPAQAPNVYSLSELALRTVYYDQYSMMFYSDYDEATGLTWILQFPATERLHQASIFPNVRTELQVIILSLAMFFAGSLIVFILLAVGYANQFVRPVFDIVDSIEQVAAGKLELNTRPIKKRKKHLFKEVMDSIHSLASVLKASKQAEIETQTYREEWIAGVMHDMKTPLSSIQGYAHMLATTKYSWSEEEVRSFASTILEKSQYMDQLMEDLALTYRLRSGELPVKLEPHSIGSLLREAAAKAAAHPLYANRSISYEFPSNDVIGKVHPPWFERIIDNLIANSLLHNPPDTAIHIILESLPDDGWQLTLSDNGKGMDEQTVKELFERYYRGTNTEQSAVGSGLGMAVTRELVQAMGGRIEITSELNKGTTFRLIWHEAFQSNLTSDN